MKTKAKIVLMLIASVSIFTIVGCKKEEKKKIKEFQETIDYLTQTNWRLTTFNYTELCSTCPDYSTLNECAKDNILKFTTTSINDSDPENFKANGTWTLTEGALTCDPNNPVSISGTWEFIPNGELPHNIISDKQFWNGTSGEIFHMVYEINSNTFRIEWDTSDGRAKQTWTKN